MQVARRSFFRNRKSLPAISGNNACCVSQHDTGNIGGSDAGNTVPDKEFMYSMLKRSHHSVAVRSC